MPRGKKLTEEDIGRLASAEIQAATSYDGTDYQKDRVRALEYYRGEMNDLENEEGTSEAVTHDVADTIGWMLPGLMRVFFSGPSLGVYEPENEEDEQAAIQATNYANYVIMKECSGYTVFWDVFHDALLHANGVVKHWWEEKDKVTVHFASGLDEDQFATIVNDKANRILAHRTDVIELPPPSEEEIEEQQIQLQALISQQQQQQQQQQPPPQGGQSPPGQNGSPPPGGPPGGGSPPPGGAPPGAGSPPGGPQPPPGGQPPGGGISPGIMSLLGAIAQGGMGGGLPGQPMPPSQPQTIEVHTVKFRRTVRTGCLKIAAVPPEEFLINIQARTIADARFVAHRMRKTRSELIAEGYDEDVVNDLPSSDGLLPDYGMLPQTRIDQAITYATYPGLDKSTEEIEIVEAYMPMDADGDGIAEMMKVVVAGPNSATVLDSELWEDEVPFTDFVAERVPHRWLGTSVFDNTEDVQRIKSTLLRQLLDNLYHANIPDRAVAIDQISNPDSLIDRKIGNIIHTEGPPGQVIADLQVPFAAKEALSGLEYMDQIVQRRTGVSESTMALDLDALQNQSATAVNAAQSGAYSKIELIARNFAEMGFKRFYQCILKLIVAHQDEPRRIKIKKQWVDMDPQAWNANMKFTPDVGLGSGSRTQDAQTLLSIAGKQEQIAQTLGPTNPLCGLDKYANTLRTLVQFSLPGADPDRYFNEINVNDPQYQQWLAQASQPQPDPAAQAEMMQAQVKQQQAQADIAIKQQKAQADAGLQQQKAQADLARQQQADQASAAAMGQKNAMQMQATREKNQMDMQLDQEKAAQDMQQDRDAALLDAQLKQKELILEAHLTQEKNRMDAVNAHHKTTLDANIQQQRVNKED